MKLDILTDLLASVVALEGDESVPEERIIDHLHDIDLNLDDPDTVRSLWLAIAAVAILAAEKVGRS